MRRTKKVNERDLGQTRRTEVPVSCSTMWLMDDSRSEGYGVLEFPDP